MDAKSKWMTQTVLHSTGWKELTPFVLIVKYQPLRALVAVFSGFHRLSHAPFLSNISPTISPVQWILETEVLRLELSKYQLHNNNYYVLSIPISIERTPKNNLEPKHVAGFWKDMYLFPNLVFWRELKPYARDEELTFNNELELLCLEATMNCTARTALTKDLLARGFLTLTSSVSSA